MNPCLASGFGWASLAVLLLALSNACGTSGRSNASSVCEAELSGKCGAACEVEGDCSSGLFCGSDEKCTAECTSASAEKYCGTGSSCSSRGRCVREIGFGGSHNGQGGSGNGECIDEAVTFEAVIPTVMFLIDQSLSMRNENFGESVKAAEMAGTYEIWDCGDGPDADVENDEYWRWNVVRNVLLNPERGVVKPLEKKVRFGVTLYSAEYGWIDPTTNEKDPNAVCPMLEQVACGLDHYAPMLDTFYCSDVRGDTPTGESLSAVAEQLVAIEESGPKIIVLATDGEPTSCDCPGYTDTDPVPCRDSGQLPGNRPSDFVKADVIARAKAIFEDDDITIHVLNLSSPGDTSLATHLGAVAAAGGGVLFDGFDPGAIRGAFDDILYGARSCKIDLDGKISAGKENTGTVKLDGKKLGFGDGDGWKRITESRIELLGEACDTIKSGDHDLDISFHCGTFIPITK